MANAVDIKTQEVLDAMRAEAQDGVYTGTLTNLVAKLGYHSYYGRIINLLKESGAATQLARGGMGVPSRWQINTDTYVPPDNPNEGTVRRRDRLEARIEALEKRLGGLDIPLAVGSIIQRLDMIELAMTGKEAQDNATDGDRQEAGAAASEPGMGS